MSNVVLSVQAEKLMKLCEAEGFGSIDDLLVVLVADSVCPAICMKQGCDYIAPLEQDQDAGYCENCRGNSMVSVLILAGLI